VDLDKKVPLLKTDEEVQDQQRFFDEQRAGGQLRAGGRAYLDWFHEIPHRLMDDPLTSCTLGPFLRMLESGTDIAYIVSGSATDAIADVLGSPSETGISGPTKVEYDADADKYYYDLNNTVSGQEATSEFGKASLEVLSHNATGYVLKGADYTMKGLYNDYKYLENLGNPMPGVPYNLSMNATYKYSASFDYQKFIQAMRLWGG
jgi:hypothetical protein